MRMWMVNPSAMCRKHLLGEHVELHMLVGAIKHNKSLDGYVEKGLIDTQQITSRHEYISKEITKRGYKHKSPLVFLHNHPVGKVDIDKSIKDLKERCSDCEV